MQKTQKLSYSMAEKNSAITKPERVFLCIKVKVTNRDKMLWGNGY